MSDLQVDLGDGETRSYKEVESYVRSQVAFEKEVMAEKQDWDRMEEKLPAALVKAHYDRFDDADPLEYAMGLRNGTVITFSEAMLTLGSPWVKLSAPRIIDGPGTGAFSRGLERGIEIAISEIAWVADALHKGWSNPA